MMFRNSLVIFLAFIILLACSQTPPAESASTPAGEAVAPLPPAESANRPAGEAGIPQSGEITRPPAVSMGVPPPPTEDFGVNCFVEFGDSITAGAPSFHHYSSKDGGLTWEEASGEPSMSGSDCSPRKEPWELWALPDGTVRYQFNPGTNILLSTDSGASWEKILDLEDIDWKPQNTPETGTEVVVQPGPLDAMIDHASGNLLLAMGHAGILLRLPSGDWQWVEAGRYYYGDLSSIRAEVARLKEQDTAGPLSVTPVMPDTVIKAHENYTTTLVFSPDGETLASSGYDGGIKLFDFPKGDLQHWQKWGKDRRDSTLYGAAFSADGSTLVTSGTNVDKTLNFWDMANGELISKYEGFQTEALDSTAFSDQQTLAIAYGEDPNQKNQIKVFHLPGGELQSTFSSQLSEITSLKFIPGTSLLAVGGFSGGVELLDIESGEKVFTLQPDQPADDRAAASRKVYSTGYHPAEDAVMSVFGDATLKAWDATNGEPAWSLSLPGAHGWYASSAAFSADGQMVALGFPNGPLMLFDSMDGSALSGQWSSDKGTLMELEFSPDSRWLAAGYASGDVKIWQVSRMVE